MNILFFRETFEEMCAQLFMRVENCLKQLLDNSGSLSRFIKLFLVWLAVLVNKWVPKSYCSVLFE